MTSSTAAQHWPSIDSLRALDAVLRLGSFERAAEALSLTPSALSKRITALEGLVGAQLVERTPRGALATAVGKAYVDQVRPLLAQYAAVTLHQRAKRGVERLRVLSPPTFARQVLVPWLGEFTAEHPHADIEVVVAIPYLDLASPRADLSVLFGAVGTVGEPLLMEPSIALAAPSLLKVARVRRADDVGRLRLLRCPLEPWRPWLHAAGLPAVEPTGGVSFVDLGLALAAAAAGQGATLTRASLAREWLRRGELSPVLPVLAQAGTGYGLRVHHASRLGLAFAQALGAHCAALQSNPLPF